MPRAGKKAANQHNTRHENGVVAPGKRITKQKSNGHLNGSPAGSVASHVLSSTSSPDAPPSTQLPAHAHSRVASGAKFVRDRAGSATKCPVDTSGELSEDPESMGNGIAHPNGSLERPHRKIDVNAVKSTAVHDNTIFNLALTILKSCPLGDTIAILIFLLSLPPTLISVTNALFAVLTFMPPAGSFSSIPTTFNDVFQGSGGTPSLATILVTDILGIVMWLVAWSPLQALGLELAQAVVATTLGGGNSSRRTGSDSTLFCMLIVLSTHVARQKWVPKRIFGYEWSVRLASISYIPEHFSGEFVHEDHQPRSAGGWFRILIALHILIQGLVHVARRWYTKRECPQASKHCKKVDPEAGGHSQTNAEAVPTTQNGFSELISKASLPISKESRDKISYGKKRRKQGTYVRSQQPLWAAFAATKVTVLREMEQSHALSEALGSNATDTKNLGNAPFLTEEGRVWITLVQPNSFFFDASYFSISGTEEARGASDLPVSLGIDRSKPFFVRINGADWTSSRIDRVSTESSKDESAGRQWTGEVYGLSPCSSYNCSFVRSEDGVIIHSAVVSTPSSPVAERELSAGLASPPQPAVRPSSPTTPSTTLKKSIAAYQTSLSESQARQKRNKKEHKATAQLVKKEIEKLNATIARQNEAEKSHSSRQLQLSQHCKQAEEALTSITEEIDSLGNVPEEETEHWKTKKAVWDEQREELDAAKEDHVRCKAAAHQESQAVEAEASTTQQKRERLQARKAKLNEQYARLESANSQELDDMGRKEAEYAARLAQQQQDEERSNEQMALLNRRIQEKHFQTQQCLQQAEMLAAAYYAQQSVELAVDSDGAFGEQDPNGAIAQGLASSNFGGRLPVFPPPENVGISNALGSFGQGTRPRSSSLLAGSTPYADFLDQDPAPPMPPAQAMRLFRGRQQSGSSGSGSNGSHRDPSSPVSAIGSRHSPVVKKGSPVWN